MIKLLGVLLILAGLVIGAYLGVWVMFIGGIVALIKACQVSPVVAFDVAISIARIIFAGAVGYASFVLCFIFGLALIRAE